MKNTIEIELNIKEKEIIIEGVCPHCMEDDDLLEFVDALYYIFNEAWTIAKERNLYGEKKQSSSKKRQKNLRKGSGQNKKD